MTDTETFEAHRQALLALAYRMLGDVSRAEDVVQDSWGRWEGRSVVVDAPRAFLLTTVTRLCLDEIGSARSRREESRGDRLPEPVDLSQGALAHAEMNDQVSMAFLVLLQRLTPAERAVFLLHDVFDMSHGEIGALLDKNDAACRQLLKSARHNVAAERRTLPTSPDEHRRFLTAFVRAVTAGETEPLIAMLADDATFTVDGGPNGTSYGRVRNVGHPVVGRAKIAALLRAVGAQQVPPIGELHERTLNGAPAIVAFRDGRAVLAILVSVGDGRIRDVFVQLDPARLGHIAPPVS